MAKWKAYPVASPVCTMLSMIPPIIVYEEHKVLEKFNITMYDRSSQATDIDAVGLDMFARKQRLYEAIPPTGVTLVQHTQQASLPSRMQLKSIDNTSNIH